MRQILVIPTRIFNVGDEVTILKDFREYGEYQFEIRVADKMFQCAGQKMIISNKYSDKRFGLEGGGEFTWTFDMFEESYDVPQEVLDQKKYRGYRDSWLPSRCLQTMQPPLSQAPLTSSIF